MISGRQLKFYEFLLDKIIAKEPIPSFGDINSQLFHLAKESGSTSDVTTDLNNLGLIDKNTQKKGIQTKLTILPLTDETKALVPENLHQKVAQAVAAQPESTTKDAINSHQTITRLLRQPPKPTKRKRKKTTNYPESDSDINTESSDPSYSEEDSADTKKTGTHFFNFPQKRYKVYCGEIRHDATHCDGIKGIKSQSQAQYEMALLAFADYKTLKELNPEVSFPLEMYFAQNSTEIYKGFEWLDLAIQGGDRNAKNYFKNILACEDFYLKEFYDQIIKPEADKTAKYTSEFATKRFQNLNNQEYLLHGGPPTNHRNSLCLKPT